MAVLSLVPSPKTPLPGPDDWILTGASMVYRQRNDWRGHPPPTYRTAGAGLYELNSIFTVFYYDTTIHVIIEISIKICVLTILVLTCLSCQHHVATESHCHDSLITPNFHDMSTGPGRSRETPPHRDGGWRPWRQWRPGPAEWGECWCVSRLSASRASGATEVGLTLLAVIKCENNVSLMRNHTYWTFHHSDCNWI